MDIWVNNFNKRYDKSHTKDHVTKWEFWNDFDIDMKKTFEIFEETWERWEHLPPTEDSLSEKTRKLNEIGDVDIVSNVNASHSGYVENWLEKYEIHFKKFVNSCNDKEKLDYDYFIDDSPRLAQKLNDLEKHCLLHEQKWNTHVKGDHISKISNLNHALERIIQIN